MNGIHDLGGMDGFGPVAVESDEPVFRERWEGRVFALNLLTPLGNIDRARHAVERIPPADYLSLPYYGRWLRGLELRLREQGLLEEGELEARLAGHPFPSGPGTPSGEPMNATARREVDRTPAFSAGQCVCTRNLQPPGHTRLPAYARGRRGEVVRVHPAFVLPDTNAHGLGEQPEHVYAVRFDGRELWGERAEPRTSVTLDCFESYLEAER